MVKLKESVLLENVSRVLASEGFYLEARHVPGVLESIIESSSDFLRRIKGKEKFALVYKDMKGNFIIAAVIEYNENPEEGQDNYNYYYTFDEADIKDAILRDSTEAQVQALFIKRMVESHSLRPLQEQVVTMVEKTLKGLSDYLHENAKEGELFELEDEGYFLATVGVEDGIIVKSLLPDGPMKTLIKDDATVEA